MASRLCHTRLSTVKKDQQSKVSTAPWSLRAMQCTALHTTHLSHARTHTCTRAHVEAARVRAPTCIPVGLFGEREHANRFDARRGRLDAPLPSCIVHAAAEHSTHKLVQGRFEDGSRALKGVGGTRPRLQPRGQCCKALGYAGYVSGSVGLWT